MENFIITVILAAIIGGALFYIYKSKKDGRACIGCPYSKSCGRKCCCRNDEKKNVGTDNKKQ